MPFGHPSQLFLLLPSEVADFLPLQVGQRNEDLLQVELDQEDVGTLLLGADYQSSCPRWLLQHQARLGVGFQHN